MFVCVNTRPLLFLIVCLQLDGMTKEEMGAILQKHDMKSPNTGNDLSEPIDFNLMFGTSIGPTGLVKG